MFNTTELLKVATILKDKIPADYSLEIAECFSGSFVLVNTPEGRKVFSFVELLDAE